ncbi:hypothetical protein GQ55_4G296400 [Panicum hallii var. hallii]|uniref:Fucosyltransferase n=1 Tax=Panicum hallii var. hallii TaxID=1504633 RepID=A0A2T7E1L2_9POAL|nr:hypothetical protein GQ55_4G296400 [Panicum hallii var. hallii]
MEAKTKMEKPVDVKRWRRAVSAVLAAVVVTAPLLVILLGGRGFRAPGVWIQTAMAGLRKGSSNDPSLHHRTARHGDRLLGGLLVDGFDEESCHSRYQSAAYRRNPGRRPSPYLVSKLRRHEALQRRCGPGTAAYGNALEQLKSGRGVASPECRYIVSLPYQGLGNRILATASAFLYALLTGRVLLIDPSDGMDGLFCEPFLGATWLLPPGFPVAGYASFTNGTAETYGNMVRNKVIGADAAETPAFAYVYLHSDASAHDKSFFWDEDHQRLLRRIQWLVMRTDNYIVPGLFLAEAFRGELDAMFPEPDAVFHHLGRYLFHPNNRVWGLVTRYHDAYLAGAAQRVGIQVRVFGAQPDSPELLEQITSCTQKHKLLPEVLATGEPMPMPPPPRAKSTKAVLVTSLKPWYHEQLKSMYWEHAAATGEVVSVHQPSHEGYQRFGIESHDRKAWAEIYMLSLADALVTTSQSTFGYVAQGLAGVRPWVMYKPAGDGATTVPPDPPCGRAASMEPCFFAAPNYNLWKEQWLDASAVVPHVQRCADFAWGGLMLVGRNE